MEEFLGQLQQHIDTVREIGDQIEQDGDYMGKIQEYLPSMNQMIMGIVQMAQEQGSGLELDPGFVVQVLQDILYGMEHTDAVFLLDALRYGLLEVYYYVGAELQGGEMG